MSLGWSWDTVWELAISGAIVSWPVFIAGLWISHRKTVRRVGQVTAEQTSQIREMTAEQTRALRGGEAYQEGEHPAG